MHYLIYHTCIYSIYIHIYGRRMWDQDIRRVIKSQQMRMSVIYMYYLNTKCSPGHHHNGFMATGALGHTHAQVSTTSSYARFCSGNLSTLWFLECQQHVSPTKTFFSLVHQRTQSNFLVYS